MNLPTRSYYHNIPKITKESVILDMANWSYPEVLPENPEQETVLRYVNNFYKGLSLWLEYRLLSRNNLLPQLLEKIPEIKPYADFSVAGLEFCYQLFARYAFNLSSAEELWGIAEFSFQKNILNNTGYYDEKTLGKDKAYRENLKYLEGFEKFLDDEPTKKITNFDESAHAYEILVNYAIRFSKKFGDTDLEFHTRKFLKSYRHLNDQMRRSPVKPVRLIPPKPKRSRSKKG